MNKKEHWAIFINNTSNKGFFISKLLDKKPLVGFEGLKEMKGQLFSKLALERFIDEEERHGKKVIAKNLSQKLKTMSSGEQKKALLAHIIKSKPDFIVLDNPFDNLDADSQIQLKEELQNASNKISFVQLISRRIDLLSFIESFFKLEGTEISKFDDLENSILKKEYNFVGIIPDPIEKLSYSKEVLIELKNVNVSYLEKPILKNINWKIQNGDFWELRGKNGSGKTTILSMITGENPKGYGQNLYIFGKKKGSGESVWEIKKQIGYFTPSLTDKFTGYHTVENMIISGFYDSIGLYTIPTELQLRTAKAWLQLIEMQSLKDSLYYNLSLGQKRLIMCVRAMIKHPVLLILDEPTAGLDDVSAALFVNLVNKFAKESQTTIIFVSHRKEPNLNPDYIYELQIDIEGSTGNIKKEAAN